jgi:hypothetical protein
VLGRLDGAYKINGVWHVDDLNRARIWICYEACLKLKKHYEEQTPKGLFYNRMKIPDVRELSQHDALVQLSGFLSGHNKRELKCQHMFVRFYTNGSCPHQGCGATKPVGYVPPAKDEKFINLSKQVEESQDLVLVDCPGCPFSPVQIQRRTLALALHVKANGYKCGHYA